MSAVLTILIPTISEREKYLTRLLDELHRQQSELEKPNQVNIIINPGEGAIGKKRNELINEATQTNSLAVAFVDDDDFIGPNYLKKNIEGIKSGADCCSLWGSIYFGKVKGKPFHHSIVHKEWFEDNRYYYRMPNHLNAIRLEHYKDLPFQETNFGEDGNFSYALRDSGRLKNEYKINETIYHYFTGEKDFEWQNEKIKEVCR